jgi:hypothetical protein
MSRVLGAKKQGEDGFVARHRTSGTSPKWFEYATFSVALIGNVIPRLGFTLATFGSVIGHRNWVKKLGCEQWFATREKLWEFVLRTRLSKLQNLTVLEFGVAYGEATRWWLARLTDPKIQYVGFDRFTGLPRAWRNMPAGSFDADGQPPIIEDSRVTWEVGNVEEKIGAFRWSQHTGPKFIIFDLDIFEPSRVVWDEIRPHLAPGDVVYFDESFDADERVLIDGFVLEHFDVNILGASPLGMALSIRDKKMS